MAPHTAEMVCYRIEELGYNSCNSRSDLWLLHAFHARENDSSTQWLYSEGGDDQLLAMVSGHDSHPRLQLYTTAKRPADLSSNSIDFDRVMQKSTQFYKLPKPAFATTVPEPFVLLPKPEGSNMTPLLDGYIARQPSPRLSANSTTYEAINARVLNDCTVQLLRTSQNGRV